MNYKNFLIKFRNKFPRSFRLISFEFLYILNFFSFFIFLPLKIYTERKIKNNLLKSINISKVIIRNDRLGDNVLTLPFILGTSENNQKIFYFSEILNDIIGQLDIKCIWQPSSFLNNKDDLLIANLATSNISTFQGNFPKNNNRFIFTQISTNPFSRKGYPISFSPNYFNNKSQTIFVNNCLKTIGIYTDTIKGIKILNSQLENNLENIKEDLLIIVVGLGIDIGRRLNNKNIQNIIKYAREKSLKPILLEEPNFGDRLRNIAHENNIEIKSCKNFFELFILFKNSKYAIGYDCGPMHIASLLTNSIILFSHTPSLHWGKHIWHKFILKKILSNKANSIIITQQINLGTLKNNWIISSDLKGCALHKNTCSNIDCSKLNDNLLKKAIKYILKNEYS